MLLFYLLPIFCNNQKVISITVSSLQRLYIKCTRKPSPIYQYVTNLVVSLPIRSHFCYRNCNHHSHINSSQYLGFQFSETGNTANHNRTTCLYKFFITPRTMKIVPLIILNLCKTTEQCRIWKYPHVHLRPHSWWSPLQHIQKHSLTKAMYTFPLCCYAAP